MKKFTVLAILFLLVSFSTYSLNINDTAPKFVNPDLEGNYIFSKNLIGKKWLIVDFFATYCEPCKIELPEIEKVVKELSSDLVECVVFGIDSDSQKHTIPYFSENPTILTVVIDQYRIAANNYGVEAVPATFLVNPQGLIEKIYLKASDTKAEELKKIILSK